MTPSRPLAATAVRVLPPALLLILVLAGLRGAIGRPRFNGPLRTDGPAIGAALAAVLAVLLIATLVRHRRVRSAGDLDTAAKLRTVLVTLLTIGIVADISTLLVGLHLKVFRLQRIQRTRAGLPTVRGRSPLTAAHHPAPALPVAAILYGLLVLIIIVAVVAISRWAKMLRVPVALDHGDEIAEEDEQTLRDAVEQGRRAMHGYNDAREAIVACYAAMEDRLGERGTARMIADTPDELLARASKAGLVRGPAARTLTRLFYEARFSTHPMGDTQRGQATGALDELAGGLAGGLAAEP